MALGAVSLKAGKRIWRKLPHLIVNRVHPRARPQGWGGVYVCVGMHAGLLTHMCAKMLLGFAMSGGCFKDQISFFFFFFMHMEHFCIWLAFTVLCFCACVCVAAGRTGSCENVLGTHPSKSPTPSQDTPPPSPSRYEPSLQHILDHMCVCVCGAFQ